MIKTRLLAQLSWGSIFAVGLALLSGCDDADSMERRFGNVMVPGSEDFKSHYLDGDDGLFIMSCRLPKGLKTDALWREIIVRHGSRQIEAPSSTTLLVRTVVDSNAHSYMGWDYEYNPKTNRMFLLHAAVGRPDAADMHLSLRTDLHELASEE